MVELKRTQGTTSTTKSVAGTQAPAPAPEQISPYASSKVGNTPKPASTGKAATGETEEQKKARKAQIAARRARK